MRKSHFCTAEWDWNLGKFSSSLSSSCIIVGSDAVEDDCMSNILNDEQDRDHWNHQIDPYQHRFIWCHLEVFEHNDCYETKAADIFVNYVDFDHTQLVFS